WPVEPSRLKPQMMMSPPVSELPQMMFSSTRSPQTMLSASRLPQTMLSPLPSLPQTMLVPTAMPMNRLPHTMLSAQMMFSPQTMLLAIACARSPQTMLSPHSTLSVQAAALRNSRSPPSTASPHTMFCAQLYTVLPIAVSAGTPARSHQLPASAAV